jgi:hypothetical protein
MHKMISELRQAGFRVYINHDRITKHRWVHENATTKVLVPMLSPKGGCTIVEIHTPEGKQYTGIAKCSKSDCYNKKRGLAIALGRAIKEMSHDPELFVHLC